MILAVLPATEFTRCAERRRRGGAMQKFGRGILGFLAGFVAGAAITLAACIAAAYLFDISQFEGAYAMGVFFGWMPLGGVVGGIIGAVWAIARR